MSQPSSEKLVRSVSEAAQHVSTVTLTFLAVCVYIGIAVFSTTHEVLLLGTRIKLPLFDVQIPLTWFFVLAPFLLVFLHLHLLTLAYLLQYKIARYVRDENPPEEETDPFFASLPLSILLGSDHPGPIRVSLQALALMTMMILPVGLLLLTQARFLPYHSAGITTWHKVLVLVDLGLIWYFAARTPDFRTSPAPENRPRFARLSRRAISWGILATILALGLSTVVAGGSAGGCEFRTGQPCLGSGFVPVDLSLVDRVLRAETSGTGEPSPDNVRGVQLSTRNLRGADFTGAELINADFRGCDLTGAVFRGADLRGARFSPYRDTPRFAVTRSRSSERLVGTAAILRDVDFREAKLARTSFALADLRRARLAEADLHGANLSQADLRGADLRRADLRGAILSAARLVSADLWQAQLHGADLREADLRGAKLVEALAIGADFKEAKTLAADFRFANLFLARGLTLEGTDLRGARWGTVAAPCGEGVLRSPRFTDLRSVQTEPETKVDWKKTKGSLVEKKDDAAYAKVLALLDQLYDEDGKNPKSCLVVLEEPPETTPPSQLAEQIGGANLLYEPQKAQTLGGWPPPTHREVQYLDSLAEYLVKQACKDYALADALLSDVVGERAPARPLLSHALARRMLQRSEDHQNCPILWSLSASRKEALATVAQKDPLRTDDSLQIARLRKQAG